jgi:hypothetical protein
MKLAVSLVAVLALATSCFVTSVVPAFGADSGIVSAKVTVAAPCITVSPTTAVDFGTHAFTATGPVNTTPQEQGGGTSSVSNCGGGAENVAVKGTNANAPSGAAWSLVARTQPVGTCDLGTNKYVLKVNAYDTTWQTLLAGFDATSTSQLLTNAGAGATVNIDYDLWMPCSGSSGGGETMTFQIVYTASL